MVLDRVNRGLLEQLAARNEPPIYTLTPGAARSSLVPAQSNDPRKPGAEIKTWDAPRVAIMHDQNYA